MDTGTQAATPPAKALLWVGRIISGIIVLFLISGSLFGIIKSAEMAPEFVRMGFPQSLATKIPVLCIICALIYAIPRTAVLGAILLTGYLGGATLTHLRIGEPFFIPVLVGVLVWLGIYLRDARVRELVPWKSS